MGQFYQPPVHLRLARSDRSRYPDGYVQSFSLRSSFPHQLKWRLARALRHCAGLDGPDSVHFAVRRRQRLRARCDGSFNLRRKGLVRGHQVCCSVCLHPGLIVAVEMEEDGAFVEMGGLREAHSVLVVGCGTMSGLDCRITVAQRFLQVRGGVCDLPAVKRVLHRDAEADEQLGRRRLALQAHAGAH